MGKREKLRIFLKLNFLKSLLTNRNVESINSRILPFRLYGKLKTSIHHSASIYINNGSVGFNSSPRVREPFPGMLEMLSNSSLTVNGNFHFLSGVHLIIRENAKMSIGSGYINRHCKIKCFHNISIGHNVAISENVSIWDSDVHEVIRNGSEIMKPIKIGNHVWIGTNAIILKGVNIGDNSIIAAGSVVNRDIPKNCLAAGNPARVIKENIIWK